MKTSNCNCINCNTGDDFDPSLRPCGEPLTREQVMSWPREVYCRDMDSRNTDWSVFMRPGYISPTDERFNFAFVGRKE